MDLGGKRARGGGSYAAGGCVEDFLAGILAPSRAQLSIVFESCFVFAYIYIVFLRPGSQDSCPRELVISNFEISSAGLNSVGSCLLALDMKVKTNRISIYRPLGVCRSVLGSGQAVRPIHLAKSSVAPVGRRGRRPSVAVEASHSAIPPAQGLFNPSNDKDNCGTRSIDS